jgi:hypothetical protein
MNIIGNSNNFIISKKSKIIILDGILPNYITAANTTVCDKSFVIANLTNLKIIYYYGDVSNSLDSISQNYTKQTQCIDSNVPYLYITADSKFCPEIFYIEGGINKSDKLEESRKFNNVFLSIIEISYYQDKNLKIDIRTCPS